MPRVCCSSRPDARFHWASSLGLMNFRYSWVPRGSRFSTYSAPTLVKPGGWVFFSTLNRNPKAYLFAVIGAEYIARMLPRGTHDYARFIKPSELAGFARAADLLAVDIKGITYRPLSKHFALSNDTSINYLMACRREA